MMNQKKTEALLLEIFNKLLDQYGQQNWWPGNSRFEIIVGAILTQGVNWKAVNKSLSYLKDQGLLNPRDLRRIHHHDLGSIIRSSIYFNEKARKIKSFVYYLKSNYNDNLDKLFESDISTLREKLLSIYGIGEETADDIILYAAQKPIFVIDTYTKRIFDRVGMNIRKNSYSSYQKLFMENLEQDVNLFNEYHALLVVHGSLTCKKSNPNCSECCLSELCSTGIKQNKTLQNKTWNYSTNRL